MAIFFRGMTPGETATLTRVMMQSGDVVDTSAFMCTAKIDAPAPGLAIGRRGAGPHPRPSPSAMGEGGRERTPRSSGSLLQAKW